jgi:CRISPR-associated protein Csy2
MKSLLLLRQVEVENANAINGLTYGFPAISHFLGFTHALSRKLDAAHGLTLGGCAVICHQHQLQAYQPGDRGDWVFALTRNPLTKEGNTAPFNEEGRVHLSVSLLIECEFDADDLPFASGDATQDATQLTAWLQQQIPCLRLAGGTITSVQQIRWFERHQEQEASKKQLRQLMMRLLPGFALIGRHELLLAHHQQRQALSPQATLLDSWLDFMALQYRSQEPGSTELAGDDGPVAWTLQPKPASGYLVPLMVGYQAISDLHGPGVVAHTRDPRYPFCFVESAYSIGQWLSPHRVESLEQIMWRYQHHDGLYLCHNGYASVATSDIDYSEENY